ncbi:hypothetical protein BDY24DRAFT_67237 [Mrakia frigida]|uniref:uncharacterized protein n=1 Tax=Mrakia frigida TaxID=29902 RepID=UPI003FCC1F42
MDEVELECFNLLQSIGVASKPASASPPPIAPTGPLRREENDRVEEDEAQDVIKSELRRSGKNLDSRSRQGASTFTDPYSLERPVLYSPSKVYKPSPNALSPPPRKTRSSSPDRPNSFVASGRHERRRSRSPSKRGPSWNASGGSRDFCTLFISDIGPTTSDTDLQELFGRFGRVEDTRTRTLKNKRIAFVEFQDPVDAKIALRQMNDTIIGLQRAQISYASSDSTGTPCRTLVASSVDPSLSESELLKLFGQHGVVYCANTYLVDKQRGTSLTFVDFEKESDAVLAQAALNGTMVGSRRMEVTFSKAESFDLQNGTWKSKSLLRARRPQSPSPSSVSKRYQPPDLEESTALLVKNLPPRFTAPELKHYFPGSSFAYIKITYTMDSSTAHLEFTTRRAAELVRVLDGITIGSRRISISFESDPDGPSSSSRPFASTSSSRSVIGEFNESLSRMETGSRTGARDVDEFGRERRALSDERESLDDERVLGR